MSASMPLITKYRPDAFEEIIGHDSLMAALKRTLESPSCPHAFLLTGPSGLGKTTIARIIGKALDTDLLEIDAATNSGVDAMRSLNDAVQYRSMGKSGNRMVIIDECHALSKPAWQAILKLLEEPPDHVYFALCTTELAKVPEATMTRAYHVPLRPLSVAEMDLLLTTIADCEGWIVSPDVMTAVIQAATGQPRKGITMLQSVWDAESAEEVRRIINLLDAGEPTLALAQALVQGKPWAIVRPLLAAIEDADLENAVVGIGRYILAAMAKADDEAKARRFWSLLDALTFPMHSFDRKAVLFAAIGRVLWSDK